MLPSQKYNSYLSTAKIAQVLKGNRQSNTSISTSVIFLDRHILFNISASSHRGLMTPEYIGSLDCIAIEQNRMDQNMQKF